MSYDDNDDVSTGKVIGIIGAVILVALLAVGGCMGCTTVGAGQTGVVNTFGSVSNDTLSPGIHMTNPFARVYEMSIRTQEIKEAADVPTSDGQNVHLEVSILYRLDSAKAVEVYKTIGLDYANVVLVPMLRSEIRGATVKHEAKALYTSGRELIAAQITDALRPAFVKSGVVLEAVLLRSIKLPDSLQNSITAKLVADQQAQQMDFTIQKERKEAERKKIEAEGIAEYQRITAKEVNEAILRWKGIEATEKLATSANAKVVVIGAGKDSLPIIMGQ